MMQQCTALKRDGVQCAVTVAPPKTRCWWHADENKEARVENASRASKARGSSAAKEIQQIQSNLKELYTLAFSGELDTKLATCLSQVANVQLRAAETSRKIREYELFSERIEALEKRAERGSWHGYAWSD